MRIVHLISVLFIILLAAGCSGDLNSNKVQFDDRNMKFTLVASRQDADSMSYTLQIKNEGQFTVRHLRMYLEYPILTELGSKQNPFKMEGKAEGTGPYHLEPGEEITYRFIAPVQEVFGTYQRLDYDNPAIELKGVVMDGDLEVPFTIGGGMAMLTQTDQF
ncbi:COG1361 family protein [Paenibacillus tarimensis]|nr:hypothetical protein [Paenibacillus tarimensis]